MRQILTFITFISFFSSCVVYNSNRGDVSIKELNYGLCQTTATGQIKMENTLTGTHGYEKDLTFLEHTDSIKAILKAQFSVEYILQSPKDKYVWLDITWKFPKGTRDRNGNILEALSYRRKELTNKKTWSTYTLDLPNEVVKGTWSLILSVGYKKLHQRNFYLY